MSNEIRKRSYCHQCIKNVPHCRRKASGYLESLLEFLQRLRIGRWHCLHCQQRRWFLLAVREDAADYRVVRSSESVDPNKPSIWSRSCSGDADADANGVPGLADVGGDFISDQHLSHAGVQVPNKKVETPIKDAAYETLSTNSRIDSLGEGEGFESVDEFDFDKSESLPAEQEGSQEEMLHDELINESIRGLVGNVTNGANSVSNAVLMGAIATIEEEVQTESQQTGTDEAEEIVEAVSVGNFIKDQSLVLKTTRLHRFTEKYRDALVDRVLAGKVKISSLTAGGKYTEAELISWIADKAKRQDKQIETLELDPGFRWNEQRRQAK